MDMTIDRECAANLRDCVYRLHATFTLMQEETSRNGGEVEMIGLNPKIIPVFDSVFTFLVSRNRDLCRDDGPLNAGCRVGLVLGESQKYLHDPNVDAAEIRFNALVVFGALLFKLFLVEIERKSLPLDECGDSAQVAKLRKFVESVPEDVVRSASALSMNDIVRVTFRNDESSAGHTCH